MRRIARWMQYCTGGASEGFKGLVWYATLNMKCLYLFWQESRFTHGGIRTRSNVEYAVTHLQQKKMERTLHSNCTSSDSTVKLRQALWVYYLKGVGGQLGAWLGLTSIHFDLVHLICQNKYFMKLEDQTADLTHQTLELNIPVQLVLDSTLFFLLGGSSWNSLAVI